MRAMKVSVVPRGVVSGTLLVLLWAQLPAQAQTPANPLSYSRASSFGYDATSGLLNAETVEPTAIAPANIGLCVVTTYVHGDAYGNKTSATTANCAGTVPVRQQFGSRTTTTRY